MSKETEKVKWHEKLCYGIGSTGGNIANYLIIGYITLFATDVVQVDAAAIGWVILVCAVLDAFTDLFVVNIADRTDTRWGKYRPWLLITGVLTAVMLAFIFWYPSFLVTEGQKLLWLFVCYFLLSPIFLTGYLCPQYVLLSVITADEKQRLSLGSARSIGEFASDLLVNGLCMSMVLWLGNGNYRDAGAWRITALVFAALTFVCCVVGFAGVRERVQITNEKPEGGQLTLLDKLRILSKSRVYVKTLLLNSSVMLATVEGVLFSYFCIYNLGHEDWLAPLCMVSTASAIAVTLLIPTLGQRMTKRSLIYIGCGFLLLSSAGCSFATGFLSVLPFVICKGFGYGLCIVCSGLLWATTSDYINKKTGVLIPGLVMASGSFAAKVIMGVCAFTGTMVLTLGGFDGAQSVQSNTALGWIRFGIVIALALSAVMTALCNTRLWELETNHALEEI